MPLSANAVRTSTVLRNTVDVTSGSGSNATTRRYRLLDSQYVDGSANVREWRIEVRGVDGKGDEQWTEAASWTSTDSTKKIQIDAQVLNELLSRLVGS